MLNLSQAESRTKIHGPIRGRWSYAVVCVAVVALVASLATKTITLDYSHHTSARAGGESVKHQKFEGCSLEWSVPVASYAPPLWVVEVDRTTPLVQPLISFEPDESIYIRPPPVLS